MRSGQATLGLEGGEVLADRDRRDAEAVGEVADADAPVLLDEAGDDLLSFAREDFDARIRALHPGGRSSGLVAGDRRWGFGLGR